jgi:hypothetical protein
MPPSRTPLRLRGRFASGRGLEAPSSKMKHDTGTRPPTQEPDSPLQIRFLRAVELIAAPLEMLAARLPSSWAPTRPVRPV